MILHESAKVAAATRGEGRRGGQHRPDPDDQTKLAHAFILRPFSLAAIDLAAHQRNRLLIDGAAFHSWIAAKFGWPG